MISEEILYIDCLCGRSRSLHGTVGWLSSTGDLLFVHDLFHFAFSVTPMRGVAALSEHEKYPCTLSPLGAPETRTL